MGSLAKSWNSDEKRQRCEQCATAEEGTVSGVPFYVDNRPERKWFNALLQRNPTISLQVASNLIATSELYQ